MKATTLGVQSGAVTLLLCLTCLPASHAQQCIDPPSGLVAWWPGDGHAEDIAGTNHGSLQNGAGFGPGVVASGTGEAFAFAGTDYVSLPVTNLKTLAAGTIDFWFNILDGDFTRARYDRLFGASDNAGNANLRNIQFYGDKLWIAFRSDWNQIVEGEVVGFTPSTEVGVWHHFAYASDATGNAAYIDGAPMPISYAFGTSSSQAFLDVGTDITVAQLGMQLDFDQPGSPFNGLLDEIEIYDRALSPSEIAAIWSSGTAGKCKDAFDDCIDAPSDLVAWWPGDGHADDIVGTNDATLQNGAGFNTGFVSSAGGEAFEFTGTEYVSLPVANLKNLTAGTIDFWFKNQNGDFTQPRYDKLFGASDNTDTSGPTYGAGNKNLRNIQFYNDKLWIAFRNEGVKVVEGEVVGFTPSTEVGVWHHLAYTSDPTGNALYLNGIRREISYDTGGASTQAFLDIGTDITVAQLGMQLNAGQPISPFFGMLDEVEVYDRALSGTEIRALYLAGTAGKCKPMQHGTLGGRIVAECPEPSTGLYSVRVDAFELNTGDLVATTATDQNGYYEMLDVAAGDYMVTVVTPLGYDAASDEIPITIVGGQTSTVDFSLSCVPIAADPRAIGFWKHQVGVALGGRGNAQLDAATLCGLLDGIEAHFNDNPENPVVVYAPPASGECTDKLDVAKQLLNLRGHVLMSARAQQHLTALLLNVGAGYIHQTTVISGDGRTVSQAITYCDQLIDAGTDYERARDIADLINSNQAVPDGWIPVDTPNYLYSLPLALHAPKGLFTVTPNPMVKTGTVEFVISSRGNALVQVYDVAGRLVRTLRDEEMPIGRHSAVWDGRGEDGHVVASGLYFYRLSLPDRVETSKFVVMRTN